MHTNLQVIIPTEYKIAYPTTLTILEYKINEISNKPFYIKEITKLDKYSNQIVFMKKNNIETEEDLNNFAKINYNEYKNLMDKREKSMQNNINNLVKFFSSIF